MLRDIAESFRAFGCILWEVSPLSDLTAAEPAGYLFVLAQWFPNELICTIHDLPFHSATGTAVLGGEPVNISNAATDSRAYRYPFLVENGIGSFCCVPLAFFDGKRGSLNLYRQEVDPFSEAELSQIAEAAAIIPSLYQALLNGFSLDLLTKINELLRETQIQDEEGGLSHGAARSRVAELSTLVADAFRCLEATVLLEHVSKAPGIFEVVGTTWPGKLKKSSYRASSRQGLTGWVLDKARAVNIFDLAHFERDHAQIWRRYRGIRWGGQDRLMEVVRAYFPRGANDTLPPLSFMAVPIVIGKRVIGAVRCSIPIKDPFYFADRELELLHLVADQIGQFWNSLSTRHAMEQENRSWKSLVESIGKLNHFAYRELNREIPEEGRIFAEALRVTTSAIEGSDIIDVRLLDSASKELFFFEPSGKAWDEGAADEIASRKAKRFPVGPGKPGSAGAYVYQTRKVRVMDDVRRDPYYSETFPSTKRMIVAPIRVEDAFFGVLDIRGIGINIFPQHAHLMAELLGDQLGLYHYLASTIGKLRQAEADLKNKVDELRKTQRQETQTYEDLAHQLKSPILLAHARAQDIIQSDLQGDKLRGALLAIRGLCGKAKRATLSVGLFADLARERSLQLNLSNLRHFEAVKLLTEATIDQEQLLDPDRHIRFHLDRDSLMVLRNLNVMADRDLLEQAISNLLDNAAKYSFSNSVVRIYAGVTGTRRFHITVANEGVPIRAAEVSKAIVRGWRGDKARLVTGDGSGIGLWIVHNIMQAHRGDLVISPTTAKDYTEVKLVFSVNPDTGALQ
jgi:signal transduction histidine kinase